MVDTNTKYALPILERIRYIQRYSSTGMILGAKIRSWDNFPRLFPKKIRYSKNDAPKFYRIKLFYLKKRQNFIQTISNP
jgi:hypothetical protein